MSGTKTRSPPQRPDLDAPRATPAAALNLARPAVTPREGDVLDLLMKGHEDKEIADKLKITRRTVRKNLQNLFAKFGVHTRLKLALAWLRWP
jgi:DNA-binding NarL/FixJ family response regulator